MEIKRVDLYDKGDVTEHIRRVGQAIIDHAEEIAVDPLYTRGITIEVVIGYGGITELKWRVEKYVTRNEDER